MTKRQRHQLDAAYRVRQYGLDRPFSPANAAATAAYTALDDAIARVHLLDRQRLHGTATSAGATEERLLIRRHLRSALSDLSRVARTPGLAVAHPDLAAQLRMGRVDSNAALLAYANNAIKVIEPVKEIFIAHGAAPIFLQEIATLIESFIAAGDRGHSGRSTRLGSNAELQAATVAMMHQVHILDAIHSIILKPNPGLMAEWQSTRRVRRTSIPSEPHSALGAQSALDPLIFANAFDGSRLALSRVESGMTSKLPHSERAPTLDTPTSAHRTGDRNQLAPPVSLFQPSPPVTDDSPSIALWPIGNPDWLRCPPTRSGRQQTAGQSPACGF
jgi:hypothetical protein